MPKAGERKLRSPLDLTATEERTLKLLALGKTVRQIAEILNLSVVTIRNQLPGIREKLQVETMKEAIEIFRKRVREEGDSGG